MKRFALVILTDTIRVKEFESKEDWDTARQTVVTAGKKCIPLKLHIGTGLWIQPESVEW